MVKTCKNLTWGTTQQAARPHGIALPCSASRMQSKSVQRCWWVQAMPSPPKPWCHLFKRRLWTHQRNGSHFPLGSSPHQAPHQTISHRPPSSPPLTARLASGCPLSENTPGSPRSQLPSPAQPSTSNLGPCHCWHSPVQTSHLRCGLPHVLGTCAEGPPLGVHLCE